MSPDECTDGVLDHDYRVKVYQGEALLTCVWCGATACGDPDEYDPCIEVFGHDTWHRTKRGRAWPNKVAR